MLHLFLLQENRWALIKKWNRRYRLDDPGAKEQLDEILAQAMAAGVDLSGTSAETEEDEDEYEDMDEVQGQGQGQGSPMQHGDLDPRSVSGDWSLSMLDYSTQIPDSGPTQIPVTGAPLPTQWGEWSQASGSGSGGGFHMYGDPTYTRVPQPADPGTTAYWSEMLTDAAAQTSGFQTSSFHTPVQPVYQPIPQHTLHEDAVSLQELLASPPRQTQQVPPTFDHPESSRRKKRKKQRPRKCIACGTPDCTTCPQ